MKQPQRQLLKEATAIHAALCGRLPAGGHDDQPPLEAWNNLITVTGQIRRAEERGWQLAAAKLRREQLLEAESLEEALHRWLTRRRSRRSAAVSPTASDIFRDLLALEQEFEELSFESHRDSRLVCARTEPIELEGVQLGRFEIRLDMGRINQPYGAYRIVATEPNASAKDSAVTHPHVQDEFLCAGDGAEVLSLALRERRLFDFFIIVRQILRTYARGQAYVELDNWYGETCHDCDGRTCSDDRSSCYRCDCTLCENCGTSCQRCSDLLCAECSHVCAGCDSDFCANCLSKCWQCHAVVCSDCRETKTLCNKCHEREQAESNDDESDESESAESDDVESDETEGEEAEPVASAES